MSQPLFEYLASSGFRKLSSIPALVHGMSRKRLIEFAQGAEAVTDYASHKAKTPYEFSASATFAGAPTPCGSLSCRLERVREMAYFASLYADRILVSSPFSGLESIPKLSDLRYEVVAGLASCLYLKPLLIAGLVQYTNPLHGSICLECYARFSGKTADEWRRLRTDLEQEYKLRVKYYIEREDGLTYIVPDGPSDLFDVHSVKPLSSVPKSMRDVVRGNGRWLMPAPLVDELRLAEECAAEVAADILGRDLCASRFGTGYLTRRELDLRVVSEVGNRQSGTVLNSDLGHEVPMLEGVALADLIKLRNDEGDTFKTYQVALRRAAIDAAKGGKTELSEVFRDVVAPEIRRMNATLASARETLLRGLAADAVGAVAFISLAFFSGLVVPGLATALTAIGGFHFTNKVATKLSKIVKQEPENARENPFYFLWKVSKIGKKSKRRLG